MIAFEVKNGRAFRESIARTRRALEDWRAFFAWLDDTGDFARMQTAWFARGGPDPRPLARLTVEARRRGLAGTIRPGPQPLREALPPFYEALKAGNSDNPDLAVRAQGPRLVWTKNTLRSTYLDPKIELRSMTFRPMDFRRQHQRTYYKRYIAKRGRPDGTFADQVNPARLWDLGSARKILARRLIQFMVKTASTAGRGGAAA